VGDQLCESAAKRQRIDPVMRAKPLVLIGEQKRQKPVAGNRRLTAFVLCQAISCFSSAAIAASMCSS
jgi:hypothetical protein